MTDLIGESVRSELARFGPAAGMADLVAAWPGAVGEAIAGNAWPARVGRDGTLYVHAASSAWAFELGQLEPTIRERLRDALGEAAPPKLRFAVGNLPETTGAAVAES
ncbi:MAG: Dna[CI] antecedent, DciA, partial [Gaiellaceae bacterium]|nr:Dna[CI] antecedent, DciA [Gaiellaceae bacterium]